MANSLHKENNFIDIKCSYKNFNKCKKKQQNPENVQYIKTIDLNVKIESNVCILDFRVVTQNECWYKEKKVYNNFH